MSNPNRAADDDFSDIDQFQNDYKPNMDRQLPGPECLPDGTYNFEILSADLTKTPRQKETIFRMRLRVLSGEHAGTILERATFFRRQESLDFLGTDLMTLGLDANLWGQRDKSWSQELRAASGKLVNRKFSGKKDTSKDKKYHNIYINARITKDSPAALAATELRAPESGENAPF